VTLPVAAPSTPVDPAPDLRASGRGAFPDRLFRVSTLAAAASVLLILGYIAYSTTHLAWPAFAHQGWSFVTSQRWAPQDGWYGSLALLYGTVVSSVIAVPVSIGVALFITELAPRRLRSVLVSLVDLLAAVPSVVFGLWGVLFLGPKLQGFYRDVHGVVAGVPVLGRIFGPDGTGQSFMTAGVILAIMVVPIITSVSREVFRTVPQADKDAALALGSTRWEMFRAAVFPHSLGGLSGAVMLGLGRAMGETIAVALVIGSQQQIRANLFKSGDTLASIIANQFGGEGGNGLSQNALIGLGVELFVMTILVNLLARGVVNRADRRMRGQA
jgi:phosphate transport system permease protein